jgi:outer membrane protein assembly factor BamA
VVYNAPVSRALVWSLVLAVLLLPALAFAQSSGKTQLSYRIAAIEVKGLSHLRPDEIIAASGLQVGQFARQADFEQAIDKLGKTGLFTHLSYSYRCSPNGCNLEFEASENEQLVPIVFDNFVWFSDDELLHMLASKLPLFRGWLPAAGSLPEEVASALRAIVEQRKISGNVTYVHASLGEGEVDSYVYSVVDHSVLMRDFAFPGAAPSELEALENAAKPLAGQPYRGSKITTQAASRLLPVYLARGYLKAKFSAPAATVVEDGPQTWVKVQLSVTPGAEYKLSDLQWSGNTVFPVSRLEEFIHLKIGQPVNAVELGRELEEIEKLYGTKGYLFARVYPSSTIEDAQRSVKYEFNVSEGELYRMGDLLVDGLDTEASKKMAAQWQMKKGAPFDNSYLGKFFELIYRDVGLQVPYQVIPKQSVNPQDRTVSVALQFVPKS